jgi:hypothetical protein
MNKETRAILQRHLDINTKNLLNQKFHNHLRKIDIACLWQSLEYHRLYALLVLLINSYKPKKQN